MPKINVLPSQIYNKIAAGEVVQRPASVVKELAENSVDAGATVVDVSISGGGVDEITVSDNGCGIAFEELSTAFLPHATSKIGRQEDLDRIHTLGFRGEALASIAAVSRVTLVSKPAAQEFAGKIDLSGSSPELSECAGADGTSVSVYNLFYHTPARLKFLKTAKTEEGEITTLLSRLILANPNVSFRYRADGREIFRSEGKGLEEAMCAVFGADILKNVLPVRYVKDGYELGGYVGKGNYSKPNRSYQILIMNGRNVQPQTLSAAVTNAYGDFLMKRQYPFFALTLKVPPEEVDVNVHPAKSEVRFSDSGRVFGIVYKTVFSALRDISARNAEAVFSSGVFKAPEKRPAGGLFPNFPVAPPPRLDSEISSDIRTETDSGIPEEEFKQTDQTEMKLTETFDGFTRKFTTEPFPPKTGAEPEKEKEDDDDPEYKIIRNEYDMTIHDAGIDLTKLKIAGTLFDTYIVAEYAEEFYLIDQHAAHERILFDRFRNTVTNNSIQPIIPYVFSLNPQEEEIFLTIQDDLIRLNFEIEPFGAGSYKVSGIPFVLTGFDIDEFFREVSSDLKSFTKLTDFTAVRDKLAQKACKAAVKAGDTLSLNEIRALLSFMKKSTLRCPHGRPVVVKFTKTEVEKWFKRIV